MVSTVPKGYEEFLCNLDAAIAWIERLGGRVDQGRFRFYREEIAELIETFRSGDLKSINERFDETASAIFEAQELVLVFAIFGRGQYDEYVRNRLRFLDGPGRVADENPDSSSNLARNLAFELAMASRFVAAGLQLDRSNNEDIVLQTSKHVAILECKRPQSKDAIERNYMRALRDLRKRYQRPEYANARGIVALDLTRVANSMGSVHWVFSLEPLKKELASYLWGFFEHHRPIFRHRKDERTVGVFARVGVLAQAPLESTFPVKMEWHQLGTLKGVPPDDECTRELSEAIDSICGDFRI